MLGRVVFVGDEGVYDRLSPTLSASGFEPTLVESVEQAQSLAEDGDADVIVCHTSGEGLSGIELCHRLSAGRPDVRVILRLDETTYDAAVTALRAGAFDVVAGSIEPEHFVSMLHRAVQHRALREEVRRLRTALAEATHFEDLLGVSPAMLQLYELLEQTALSQASVLISGESGTGKELVARALHRRSKRRDGPFVAINCSAIPDALLESELFGHVKGAYTDARVARSGLLARATGGTLFLDEIGDLPLTLQPKLLRALQERVVRPVGGDTEVPFDARIVSATNKNIEQLVADKEFREDLYYRINVIHVEVPALRDRASDVILLAQHYVEHFSLMSEKVVTGLSPMAAQKILAYPWPGNVRELQNCIERAVALTQSDEVQLDDLPEKVRKHRSSHILVVGGAPSQLVTMEEVERRYILRVMEAVKGNKKEAARILGFDRKTLYRKLQRYAGSVASD